VITASHNPPEYNGYKAYNEHGNQMLTEEALSISSQMAKLGLDNVLVDDKAQENPLCHWIGEDVIESYYARLLEIAPRIEGTENLRVLYTPLHGTGGRFVPEILQMAGFTQVATVEEQMAPDGSFPTVSYPNPEDPKAFNLAFAQAKRDPCDLIIATDPDADRMGVAVHQVGEWVLLNGNQVGVLLADFLLSKLEGDRAKRSVVIKTIVTTEMVRPIAKKYGAEVRDTLTGFKYIGTLMDRLPAENLEFLFGFEESYGYLGGMAVRDKDAVLASLLIAQVAAFYQGQGITLVDRLEELLAEHGYYLQDLVSYSFATSLEAERSRAFIKRLEQEPITTIGPEEVVEVLNYGTSIRLDLRTQEETAIALPQEGVLQWITAEGSKITLRPSGTEPKMKLYLEVQGTGRQDAQERLGRIKEAFDELVQSGLQV
jgi:phosphoglucomutase